MMCLLDSKLFVILDSKQIFFYINIKNGMLNKTNGSSRAVLCLWKWYQEKVHGRTVGLYFRVFKTFLTMAQLDTELALQYRNHSHTCAFLYIWTFLTPCIEFLLFEATDPNPLNWFHKPLMGSQPTAWKFLLYLLSVSKAKDKYLALLLCFKSGRPICEFAKSHLLVTQILQAY